MASHLDPYAKPPEFVKQFYKSCQKKPLTSEELNRLQDFTTTAGRDELKVVSTINHNALSDVFREFCTMETDRGGPEALTRDIPIFEHEAVPGITKVVSTFHSQKELSIQGLQIVPSLIPPSVQRSLVSRLLHRDLSNPVHLTNIHKFYSIPRPRKEAGNPVSFFSDPPSNEAFLMPLDPTVHKPLSRNQFLNRKLRWMTLGGQYDWTAKVYPAEKPPGFPTDIERLLTGLFPDMKPEAAIVNVYSPGDVLSMHRDVAEYCDRGLVSISLGCDAIFVVALDVESTDPLADSKLPTSSPIAIRLQSGDAVYMTGPSRFAWHGVPQIIPNTCPDYLANWPSADGELDEYEEWKGWMATKRINLNVRQMFD